MEPVLQQENQFSQLVWGGLQTEVTLNHWGILLCPRYSHLTFSFLQTLFYEKQKVRTTILLLPAAVASRSQAAAHGMATTPEFYLQLSPLEPEHRKKTFNCYGQTESLLPANSFLFP